MGQKSSTNTVVKPTFAAAEITYQQLLVTGGVEKFSQPEATQTPKGSAGRAGIGGATMALAGCMIAISWM